MSTADLEAFQFPSNNLDEQLANVAMNNVEEGIIITDQYNRIIYVNHKFETITGFSFTEVKGKTPKVLQSGIQDLSFYEKMKEVVRKTGKWRGELWNRKKNGNIYLQSLTIVAIKNNENTIENFVGILSDLLHSRSVERKYLQHVTYYDPLTSFPNRFLFEKRVVSTIRRYEHSNNHFAIVYFQLENFTKINEQHGFLFGDILLKRTAERINNCMPDNSMVARWNGTEFACILEEIKDVQQIKDFLHHLADRIKDPTIENEIEVHLKASFGVSLYRKDGTTVSTLLSKANAAMALARKEQSTIQFYEPTMGKPKNFFIMELELKRAIKEEQFELFYQPLISVDTNELVGFEALIRWNHPTEGLISPLKFIPLAEQTGLIIDIGNIVFRQACEQLKEWKKQGFTDIKISVNLSMNQFRDRDLVENFIHILDETGVSPNDIGIELTESSLIDNMEATTLKLNQLKNIGFYIAVDDFGTGYSSLGYLIDFPINRIKIDRSFIKVMGKNKKIEAIVSAISTMAKTMDIEVVAEGIETKEQLALSQKLNCNVVQGYLFDKPLPIHEVEQKWLIKMESK